MKAYVFRAALFCESCGELERKLICERLGVTAESMDSSNPDSNDWPCGPYGDGGGEADTPQHCGSCGEFLENPLTDDGAAYVKEAAAPFMVEGESWEQTARRAEDSARLASNPVLATWIRFYFAWGQ